MPDVVISIRPEAPGDEEAIDAIVRDAFLQQFGSDSEVGLVRTMRDRGELVAEVTLVAERDGQVVGFIAFSEVTLNGLFGFQRGVMVSSRSQLGLPA